MARSYPEFADASGRLQRAVNKKSLATNFANFAKKKRRIDEKKRKETTRTRKPQRGRWFLCCFFVVFAQFVVSLSFTCLVVVVFAKFAKFVAKSFLLIAVTVAATIVGPTRKGKVREWLRRSW
jgi:hypothetical protein